MFKVQIILLKSTGLDLSAKKKLKLTSMIKVQRGDKEWCPRDLISYEKANINYTRRCNGNECIYNIHLFYVPGECSAT